MSVENINTFLSPLFFRSLTSIWSFHFPLHTFLILLYDHPWYRLILYILPFGAFTSVSADSGIQDGGTFYQDFPEAANSPLGAAQYFHVFANDVTLKKHTNGNIAA